MSIKGKGGLGKTKAGLGWRGGNASIDTEKIWNNSGIWESGKGDGWDFFNFLLKSEKVELPYFFSALSQC